MADNRLSEPLPGLTLVTYRVRGPHTLRFGDTVLDGGVTTQEALGLTYERQGDAGARQWRVEIDVDRADLLPLAHAEVINLTPPEILRYTIQTPISLWFTPTLMLAQALDEFEDREPLVSPVTKLLDPRLKLQILDTRNLIFLTARQVIAPAQT